jgi:hypothetical protein
MSSVLKFDKCERSNESLRNFVEKLFNELADDQRLSEYWNANKEILLMTENVKIMSKNLSEFVKFIDNTYKLCSNRNYFVEVSTNNFAQPSKIFDLSDFAVSFDVCKSAYFNKFILALTLFKLYKYETTNNYVERINQYNKIISKYPHLKDDVLNNEYNLIINNSKKDKNMIEYCIKVINNIQNYWVEKTNRIELPSISNYLP